MTKVLLDTNAYSLLLKGDEKIKNTVEHSNFVYMSTTVIGELLAAFKGGSFERKNRKILNDFLEQPTVIVTNVNLETAEYYAEIFSYLKKRCKPIPINDVWIAAGALEMGAILITHDKHFTDIPNLRIWDEN